MRASTPTKQRSRTERYLESTVKNLRAALPDLSMEQFVAANLQALFGLEREEYLERVTGDKGNGYYPRSLQSLLKEGVMIKVPRTRTDGFSPIALELIRMSQEQVNELVLTLYKKGMTTRDVADVMTDFFGDSVSHTTVSNLAEQFHGVREAWERSSLDTSYRVIFCDCLFVTVRRGVSYEKEAVYVAYGVTTRNTRELLALSISPTESLTTWREIFSTLTARGVRTVGLVVADGIPGMEDVILETWQTRFQKCVVHKMRNVLNDVRPKDKQAVAHDLSQVFDNFDAEATLTQAYEKVRAFVATWQSTYPRIVRHFDESTLPYYFTYLAFPPEVRRLIYTTNSIENLNKQIRKATKTKLSFESPERLLDYVFIIIKEFEHKNWERFPVYQFSFIHMHETHNG
jgi:transposase-like protein